MGSDLKEKLESKKSEDSDQESCDFKEEMESKNAALIEDLNTLNEELKKRGERLDKLEQINKEKSEKIKALEDAENEKMDNIKFELDQLLKIRTEDNEKHLVE